MQSFFSRHHYPNLQISAEFVLGDSADLGSAPAGFLETLDNLVEDHLAQPRHDDIRHRQGCGRIGVRHPKGQETRRSGSLEPDRRILDRQNLVGMKQSLRASPPLSVAQ